MAGLARNGQHQADGQSIIATVMMLNITPGTPASYKLGHCDTMELLREYDMEGYQNPYSRCVDHLPSSVQSGGKVITGHWINGTPVTVCVGDTVTLHGSIQLVDESADNELGLAANNGLTGRVVGIYRRTPSGGFSLLTTTTAQFVAGTWSANVTSSIVATYIYQGRYAPAIGSQDELTLNGDNSGETQVTFSSPPCPL